MGDFSRVNPIEKFMYRYYCVDIHGAAVFLNGTAFFPCEALNENLFFCCNLCNALLEITLRIRCDRCDTGYYWS